MATRAEATARAVGPRIAAEGTVGPTPSRLLIPREHGAYGQLLTPLATALLMGLPTRVSFGLAAVCVLAFMAHEPVVVLLGQRGPRARRDAGWRAARQLGWMAVAILAAGGVAIAYATPTVRQAFLLVATLGAMEGLLVAARLERTVPGEMAAAVALTSCAFPVALAGGSPPAAALTCWAAFAASQALATLAVRSVIARVRGTTERHLPPLAATSAIAVLVGAVALLTLGRVPWAGPVAVLPVATIALALAVRPPHPRHLRRVGWSILATSLLGALVLIVGLPRG